MDDATVAHNFYDCAISEQGAHAVIAPPKPGLDSGRVRDIVLVCIATTGKVLARADLACEIMPIVAHLVSLSEWQAMLDRDLGALADAGLCHVKPVAVEITAAGSKRAALVLGANALPRTWSEAKSRWLVAKALGLDQPNLRKQRALAKADGLRAAIVQQAFKLKVRGSPTPTKLRVALAALALSRAFGNTLPEGATTRSGLSAKAGRSLAGRLAHPPREFATDSRLLAALAMEHSGAAKADFSSLQTALLRQYVTRGPVPAPMAPPRKTTRHAQAVNQSTSAVPQQPAAISHTRTVPTNTARPKPAIRPDFPTFVTSVHRAAQLHAEGFPGNRKAFVSRVWLEIQSAHPEWIVSAIEFKAMLIEAHRLGHIALANADLKDNKAIGDLQASAIAYKNAVFHYVRVDD